MNARTRWLMFFGLLATLLAPLTAQSGRNSKFSLQAAFEPATAKPGDEVTLVLSATVEFGWHAYGSLEKTNIPVGLKTSKLQLGGLELVGEPQIPAGERHATPVGDSFPLPNDFVVKQKLKVPAGAAAGEVTLSGALDYQICDENMCLPPTGAKFSAKLTVAAGAVAAPAPVAAPKLGTKPGLKLVPDPIGGDEKVTIKASFEPATVRAGEPATLVLDVTIDERYHAYGTKETTNTPVNLDGGKIEAGVLELEGDPIIPAGEKKEWYGTTTYPLPHHFQIKQVLRVPPGTAPGALPVKGLLDYQICDENSCDPPGEGAFTATLTIEAGAARVEAATPVPPTPKAIPKQAPTSPKPAPPSAGPGQSNGSSKVREPKYTLDDVGNENALTGSLWSLILLSIAGGLFALVMPCTYPMIPITFSFFTKQADRRNGKVLSLAITYGIGIVLMFMVIGVAVGGAIISFAGHWATNLVIGVAFVAFALSLFGFFTLQLPSFVTNAAGKASAAGGLFGVFLMGATLVVSSFTCTAPVVGALLAGVAEGGYGRVALGMGVFGLTMAAPFVFLALLPGRVKALPKSGDWMTTLKVSLGFVELAAALKFFSNVDLARGWHMLPRESFLMIWAFVFVLLALFLFGLMGHRGAPVVGTSATRTSVGLASLAFAFYCLFGTMGFALDPIMTAFEPPYRLRPVDEHTIVKDDYEAATALAERDNKYVLVNFTGFT
ncbi:MAG: cytochrome c biogenesis protein CcdA [Planctomycetota bacterium]